MDRRGRAVIGYEVSEKNPVGDCVPLTISKAPARLYLSVLHTLELDDSETFLTTDKSTYTLQADSDTAPIALTRTIPAGEFKAKCLKLMDEVNETGATIVITKRGRPVSRLVPVERARRGISGIFPEFAGFVDDPSETVIGPEDVQALEAGWDVSQSPSAPRGA